MNVLIYFPYNHRTVEQQSVLEMLKRRGYNVVLLTTIERGYLHRFVEKIGIVADSVPATTNKLLFYKANLQKLAALIKKHKIDVVIAHQQTPAFIAGVLKKIMPFKLLYVRHNSDEDYQNFPFKAKVLNQLVNRLTPIKIAPSSVVKDFWLSHEKVNAKEIRRINYGYDFAQYEKADPHVVAEIRKAYRTKLLILSIARLVLPKRHKEMFSVVKRLLENGYDCKLICLGTGNLQNELEAEIRQHQLGNHIFLLGQKKNVIDYFTACDVFMHLSSTEASNSAVKEAGLCKKTVIVCKGVGDFEDYIVNGENGFLVSKEQPADETYQILANVASTKINISEVGENLYRTVSKTFDIYQVENEYHQLLQSLV